MQMMQNVPITPQSKLISITNEEISKINVRHKSKTKPSLNIKKRIT